MNFKWALSTSLMLSILAAFIFNFAFALEPQDPTAIEPSFTQPQIKDSALNSKDDPKLADTLRPSFPEPELPAQVSDEKIAFHVFKKCVGLESELFLVQKECSIDGTTQTNIYKRCQQRYAQIKPISSQALKRLQKESHQIVQAQVKSCAFKQSQNQTKSRSASLQ